MAFESLSGAFVKPVVTGKKPVRDVRMKKVVAGAACVVGASFVAPAAKAVTSTRAPLKMSSSNNAQLKGSIETQKFGLDVKSVDWSLFFSSLRAV